LLGCKIKQKTHVLQEGLISHCN